MLVNGPRWIHLVSTLVQLLLLPLASAIAFGRMRLTLRDFQLLFIIQVFIWLVIPIPGSSTSTGRSRRTTCGAFTIMLALFVPYRLALARDTDGPRRVCGHRTVDARARLARRHGQRAHRPDGDGRDGRVHLRRVAQSGAFACGCSPARSASTSAIRCCSSRRARRCATPASRRATHRSTCSARAVSPARSRSPSSSPRRRSRSISCSSRCSSRTSAPVREAPRPAASRGCRSSRSSRWIFCRRHGRDALFASPTVGERLSSRPHTCSWRRAHHRRRLAVRGDRRAPLPARHVRHRVRVPSIGWSTCRAGYAQNQARIAQLEAAPANSVPQVPPYGLQRTRWRWGDDFAPLSPREYVANEVYGISRHRVRPSSPLDRADAARSIRRDAHVRSAAFPTRTRSPATLHTGAFWEWALVQLRRSLKLDRSRSSRATSSSTTPSSSPTRHSPIRSTARSTCSTGRPPG